jgi:hypothetical protein
MRIFSQEQTPRQKLPGVFTEIHWWIQAATQILRSGDRRINTESSNAVLSPGQPGDGLVQLLYQPLSSLSWHTYFNISHYKERRLNKLESGLDGNVRSCFEGFFFRYSSQASSH